MQPALLPNVPRTLGLHAEVIGVTPEIRSFAVCMQRAYDRITRAHERTFFRRPIKSRVHDFAKPTIWEAMAVEFGATRSKYYS